MIGSIRACTISCDFVTFCAPTCRWAGKLYNLFAFSDSLENWEFLRTSSGRQDFLIMKKSDDVKHFLICIFGIWKFPKNHWIPLVLEFFQWNSTSGLCNSALNSSTNPVYSLANPNIDVVVSLKFWIHTLPHGVRNFDFVMSLKRVILYAVAFTTVLHVFETNLPNE